MIHLTDSILLIEVPEDAIDFFIVYNELSFWSDFDWLDIDLPKGSYTILGTIKKGKPDFDVEPYVEHYAWEDTPDGEKWAFKDYKDGKETDDYEDMYQFDDATDSFLSLLQSKQVDMSKHYLVIEKQ